MQMTDSEIVRDYNSSRKKTLQIGILADLNLCSKKQIVDILSAAGAELPKKYQKNKKADDRVNSTKIEESEPKKTEVRHETLVQVGYEELDRLNNLIRQQEKIIERAEALKSIYEEDYKVMLKFLGIGENNNVKC